MILFKLIKVHLLISSVMYKYFPNIHMSLTVQLIETIERLAKNVDISGMFFLWHLAVFSGKNYILQHSESRGAHAI